MLVTLEGLDGSGKSSVATALPSSFPDAVFTQEPTETWYGDAVNRSVRDDDADSLAELFLFTADHAAHLSSVVKPALDDDALVISDRYTDSRYAYQGAAIAGRVDDPLAYIQSIHAPFTIPPDRTLYFDVPPAVGAERSGTTNKFERTTALERVRDNYERLIANDPDRFVRIDATQPLEDVIEDAATAIREFR